MRRSKRKKPKREPELFATQVENPRGTFVLWGSRTGLYRLDFPQTGWTRPFSSSGKAPAYLKRAARRLDDFFQGKSRDLKGIPVDFSGYTPFQEKVLRTLWKSRSGTVTSYGALAASCGHARAGRAVGTVMKRNRLPIFIPCHRVLSSQGKIGGYSLGLPWKEWLLELERTR
ncbi:MAG TPA: methylated-DNA--[protein]-cysteine S-methyltransferase [Verrucomicrobiae bacterium]|jgi:methylated-DNA-[protein]-cysteine S-methyltransferase|nr:methylated-DNA--[protein]-cysteine S-methyltransferase [Verrucomicrobiae bacterium]